MHQRARGELRLAFKQRAEQTVLDRLRQDGCLKARFPRGAASPWTEAVVLNSSGGVAGGDRLAVSVAAGPGAHAIVASQAAERFYRALAGSVSTVSNTIRLEPGAALEWLPQESIIFDGAALRRELRVEIAAGARFLGVESLVFGRTAMGETVREAALSDLIEIRRQGRLLLHDRIRLDGPVASLLARPAIGAGCCAVATLIHVAPDAETMLDPLRDALTPHEAGASAWNGMLVARIVAETGARLRQAVIAGLHVLRQGRTLPRVWSC